MDRKIIRIIILCVCLLGCTSKLKDDNEIETGLQQLFPYMIIENDETGTYDNEFDYKRYTINNNGITFTYENYQCNDTLFGGTTTNSRNDYCTNLYEHFLDDINDISLKYNIQVESTNTAIEISHPISDMNEIALGVQAANTIYELVEDYIPQTTLNWFPFKIAFTTSYSGGKTTITINQQGDFDESYILNLTYMNFKNDINQGLVSNVKISNEHLDTIPQKYINSLYIDNILYQSDQYKTIFLYNVEDNR